MAEEIKKRKTSKAAKSSPALKKSDPKTTGHSWDGIEEFDNPDPSWLRYLFYLTLFYCLGYWVLYPSFPSQRNDGALGWSQYLELENSLEELDDIRSHYLADFRRASFEEILKDESLMRFAIAGGKSAFHNNCSVCHGVGGRGNIGYPNLTVGSWLWGGKPEDIYTTLQYGIRSGHDEARDSQMAAFGRDGILDEESINLLVDYVMSLREGADQSSKAHGLYMENCASCHGDKGQGGRDFGAPALNDAIWLYGGDRNTIYDVIYNGRQGVMPYWSGKLDDDTIRQLSIYVHQLGGGE